jgi:hypothetical protein
VCPAYEKNSGGDATKSAYRSTKKNRWRTRDSRRIIDGTKITPFGLKKRSGIQKKWLDNDNVHHQRMIFVGLCKD